ncbi:glycoside hydrolase family 75 protein [Mangrovicella endophytica]|uniref:glycoside hydrolase family 75 protein n=1 Tax=Mangrovicella endophytica TaxID=2066697 RepID=UPI000C9E294A|nr:glycoside hydrolase family 75 protein [Mangrovicella endophytica]
MRAAAAFRLRTLLAAAAIFASLSGCNTAGHSSADMAGMERSGEGGVPPERGAPASTAAPAYQPPAASRTALAGIRFEAATPVDPDYERQFTLYDTQDIFRGETMTGYRRCSNDPNRLESLLRLPSGAILFESKMALDVDGGYRPCAGSGGATNLCPTTFVYPAAKAWSEAKRKSRWPEAYVTSDLVPYVVLPIAAGSYAAEGREFTRRTGVRIGDVGVIVYKDKVVPVLVADGGPHNKIGEGSLAAFDGIGVSRCARRLASDPRFCEREKNYSLEGAVVTVLFPGSAIDGLTPDTVNAAVRAKALALFAAAKRS